MPSELQKLAERIRTIADQCKGWSVAAGKQAGRSRATARRARALRERHRGNPALLDALVAQLDAAAQENEKTAAGLAQLARMLFEFAAWLALPGGPGKAAKRPADLVAGSGLLDPPTPPTLRSEPAATEEPIPPVIVDAAAKLREMLPRGVKTVGQVLDGDGQSWGPEIWSGTNGPAKGAPGLRTDGTKVKWHRLGAVLHHVEGHAAALLRRDGAPKHVTLVISKEPCAIPVIGCQSIIDDVLPRGSSITVYVANEDGTVQKWNNGFNGNGRGLQ